MEETYETINTSTWLEIGGRPFFIGMLTNRPRQLYGENMAIYAHLSGFH
ncbi:MAG: hypothetical protein LBR98_06035 [Syntrophomonadaceae bacterium]|nr:hypothetical protein [Syntrophomonadaceae bacterium]